MFEIVLALLSPVAWLAGLFGPPALAVWFWHSLSKRYAPWIAHLFFLPVALGVEWLATNAIFIAAQDDGDGPPGLGLALILPFATLIGTLAVYYGALAWNMFRRLMTRQEQ